MKQIHIRLTETQIKKLERTRQLNGASIANTIRRAIDELYERQQSKLGDR